MGIPNPFALKDAWNKFSQTHPKVPGFIDDVKNKGFCEGQEIAIAARYPDGVEYKTGIRVRAEDLALLDMLKNL